MPDDGSLLRGIQARVSAGDYRFTLHAGDRATRRHISVKDIGDALQSQRAEVIENYPEDPRGPSCLIVGFTAEGRPLHVQCTYPPNVAIVTAYEPNPEEWIDWRARKVG